MQPPPGIVPGRRFRYRLKATFAIISPLSQPADAESRLRRTTALGYPPLFLFHVHCAFHSVCRCDPLAAVECRLSFLVKSNTSKGWERFGRDRAAAALQTVFRVKKQ